MPRIHRLKHVDHFASPYFPDDDPIGSHPQAVANQGALGDFPRTFHTGRTRLETDHMGLLKAQFCGILDGHQTLIVRDETGQYIEQGCFSAPGPTRDQDIQAGLDHGSDQHGHFRGHATVIHQIVHTEGNRRKTTDGQGRPIQRQGGDDGIDP